MSDFALNPAWKAYNDLMNEGGEGYNPHKKWIAKAPTPGAANQSLAADRMITQADGRLVPESKIRARLAKAEATLPSLTDKTAIAIFERDIAADRKLLGL